METGQDSEVSCLMDEILEELKTVGYVFYAKKVDSAASLLIVYNSEKKRFVVCVLAGTPPKPIISIPVDLTIAETKASDLFKQVISPYVVWQPVGQAFTSVPINSIKDLEQLKDTIGVRLVEN